jgi:hypothetical protein
LVASSVTENLSERQEVGSVMLYHTLLIPLQGSAFNERALANLLADTTDSADRPNLNAL